MSAPSSGPAFDLAAPDQRLGMLQRGRGAGYTAALAAPAAARDELLQCVLQDPRIDRELESRARYYAELLVALDARLVEPIAAGLRGAAPGLGHDVLAACWRLGCADARRLFEGSAAGLDEALVQGVAAALVQDLQVPLVQLPASLHAQGLSLLCGDAQCAAVAASLRRSIAAPGPLAGLGVDELLELGRGSSTPRVERRLLLRELCARGDEASREQLAVCVRDDLVYGRVRLAAAALGTMGDERLLELAREHFAREDELDDPARRLSGFERMRRAALSSYVQHLPEALQRALAREWHEQGDYFATVAGVLFAESAEGCDRERLEQFVRDRLAAGDSGFGVVSELDALARVGDARSVPVLAEVAGVAAYSHARRRALHGLALLVRSTSTAVVPLAEALWDCEDEAAADAVAFLPELDAVGRARLDELASSPLVDDELLLRVVRRRRRAR